VGSMNEPLTIPDLLAGTVGRAGDHRALGIIQQGQLSWKTWTEIGADVLKVARAFSTSGVVPGDRVAQFAPNSYAWIVTDLAILTLGAVHVPLHASLGSDQVAEQLVRSGAKLVVVDSPGRIAPDADLPAECWICPHEGLFSTVSECELPPSPSPDALATILFTSGTTGQPRGVMLSHGNLTSNAIAVTEAVASPIDETRLGFLPLSHIYARTCDLYSWIYRGSRLVLAESRETIIRDCQLAKPNVLNGVPYFYQKVAQQLHAAGKADVPDVLRELLGGELQQCFCGGAAMPPEIESLFEAQGLPLLSGYGLTETSPVVSATRKEDYRPGIVGRPLEVVEVRLSDEPGREGEILVRGPNVMQGYWQDEGATREVLRDGWLATGDLGEFDEVGNLRIIGRLKEIIVLATGKNVSPMAVEGRIAGSPLVESVCVVGEGRNQLGALIVPNPDALRAKIKELRLWVWSRHRAVTHRRILALYREEIDRLLTPASREEQIGPFVILDRGFSLEGDEVTAKFSLRRQVIEHNFSQMIETMYRNWRATV